MAETSAPNSRAKGSDVWLAETWEANRKLLRGLGYALLLGIGFFLLIGLALGPIAPGNSRGRESGCLQQAHTLGLAMYAFAMDHNGAYPDGASSTEVFQKLLDGGYITDPSFFFIPMPGKTGSVEGQKLKPENVCFDVTGGVDLKDSGELPVLVTTGYRLTYAPGGSVVPIHPPGPEFERPAMWPSSWFGFRTTEPMNGLAVYYLGNRSVWITAQGSSVMAGQSYSLPHVIPADFDAHGKAYRQLTPEGALR